MSLRSRAPTSLTLRALRYFKPHPIGVDRERSGLLHEIVAEVPGGPFTLGGCFLCQPHRSCRGRVIVNPACSVDDGVELGIRLGSVVKGVLLVDGTTILGKDVVLTAGVYGTAAILLRSGIGPKEYIGALGLKLVADLPHNAASRPAAYDNYMEHAHSTFQKGME